MAELVAAPRSSLVDPAVRQKLRIHQLQACDFVLDRLFPEAFSVQPSTLEQNPFVVPQTGAIIADDVGTGKTFVALSIIFTLCKSKSCKAVVVCPTSLIGNWEKEAKQWFPGSLGRTHLCICSSSGQSQKTMDLLVNRFVTSHPTVHPMLIIGYEMFRTYAEALNAINSLELLVCDEGHRLKNIMGTQTSLALANCVAQRRLVLTGTVLQNNLDELFAVVQFVIPDYLGTIKEFRREYADPIMKSKAAEATAEQKRKGNRAEEKLRECLSHIIMRRTQNIVMRHVLPPRRDVVLFCEQSPEQQAEYKRVALLMLDTYRTIATAPDEKNSENSDSGYGQDSADSMADDDRSRALKRARRDYDMDFNASGGAHNNARTAISAADIDKKDGDASRTTKSVLAHLTRLRLLCGVANVARQCEASAPCSDSAASGGTKGIDIDVNSKLRILLDMLKNIRKEGSEKVVVVSNFTSTLDCIQTLARTNRWGCLKLDGSVTPENRQKMVGHFNKDGGLFFLMLLSAKAGGVGLNLVGASRLIMFDCDWNPATDIQAMGRIWREGQQRPVFIYRLIARGTIEESILARQGVKGLLSTVIREESAAPAVVGSSSQHTTKDISSASLHESENSDEMLKKSITSMTRSDLAKLVFPTAQRNAAAAPGAMQASAAAAMGDTVLRELIKTQGGRNDVHVVAADR